MPNPPAYDCYSPSTWIFIAQDYPDLTTGTTLITSNLEANRASHATFYSLDHFPVQLLHCSLLARIAAKVPDLKGFAPIWMQHIYQIYESPINF
jgi:hypothetical protein